MLCRIFLTIFLFRFLFLGIMHNDNWNASFPATMVSSNIWQSRRLPWYPWKLRHQVLDQSSSTAIRVVQHRRTFLKVIGAMVYGTFINMDIVIHPCVYRVAVPWLPPVK
jgi:hypothetical protein